MEWTKGFHLTLFVGVSADLKRRFGEGFKLSVHVEHTHNFEVDEMNETQVNDFIQKFIPKATLTNKLSSTYTYQIPSGNFEKNTNNLLINLFAGCITLSELFSKMESVKSELHITDWAVTNTTLEEVFLTISASKQPNPQTSSSSSSSSSSSPSSSSSSSSDQEDSDNETSNSESKE